MSSHYEFVKGGDEAKLKLQEKELRDYENNYDHHDLSAMSRRQNWSWLKNYGRDRYTYTAEQHIKGNEVFAAIEPMHAWGYPDTYLIQALLIYGVGIHTAKRQGIIAGHNYFCRFWRNHWFDWTTFIKNGFIYGYVGGQFAGMLLVGEPDLAWKRTVSKWNQWMVAPPMEDFRMNESHFTTNINY